MARNDALLRLQGRLEERQRELNRILADEMGDLQHELGSNIGGDDADAALDTVADEMSSQLAQIASRELHQVDRALARLRAGAYGHCEMCSKKIPISRLTVRPFTTLCIGCQRELEANPHLANEFDGGWQKVYDNEATGQDDPVNLSDLEFNVGG